MLFDYHVTEMSKKVSGILRYISIMQDVFSKEARLIAVQNLSSSHMYYGSNVWGPINVKILSHSETPSWQQETLM